MGDREVTDILGRLLTDAGLRRAFLGDAPGVLRALGLPPEDAPSLLALDPVELEAQAELLLDKRFHEVRGLLPHSLRLLDPEARDLFQGYVQGAPWPSGFRRHLLDALAFATWLRRAGRAMDALEVNRLRFQLDGARWRLHLARSTRTFLPALQCLLRGRGGRLRQWTLSLGP